MADFKVSVEPALGTGLWPVTSARLVSFLPCVSVGRPWSLPTAPVLWERSRRGLQPSPCAPCPSVGGHPGVFY